ncbi:hypothetical protein DNH61_00230 [Paenibacillus sambharensis]|uniref:O-antigen ligase domain-containing protein n=1 Tax=Paenibacillus sambharensis TaxID=1803190 RepID=A0A2W1LGB5_9BACL|nr:hypothetical protein [Paenibacillus sambharensis]PZD97729.1 hypothetical protein DNH61_00230 [Paenibacillus sambharensis]
MEANHSNGSGAAASKGRQLLFSVYLMFLLVMTVYQDFPLVNMVGEIGRTPVILMLPVFLGCELLLLSRHKRLVYMTKLQKYMTLFVIYITVVSLLYVYIHFLLGSYTYGSENLLSKAVKIIIYLVLILLYIRHLYFVFSQIASRRLLFVSFFSVTMLLFGIMLIELVTAPYALPFLHSKAAPYWRVRLLTSESSTTGTIVMVFAGICLYLASSLKSSLFKAATYGLIGAFFLNYLVATSSKGFYLVLLATMAFAMLKFMDIRKKRNFLLIAAGCAAIYIVAVTFMPAVISSLNNDMENYTSSYTRFGTILISLVTIATNPFGVGTGAFLLYFEKNMQTCIQILSDFYYQVFGISEINTGELMMYANTDKNVAVKSGVFQWIMYGGIGAVLFFFALARNMLASAKRDMWIYVALLFVLFSLLFISLEIKYEVWLLFAFISFFMHQQHKPASTSTEVSV